MPRSNTAARSRVATLCRLCIYLLGHFMMKALRHPRVFLRDVGIGLRSLRREGLSRTATRLLTEYLPKIYLLRTRLHIRTPSDSIYPKLARALPQRTWQAPVARTPEGMATPTKILLVRAGAMGDVLLATPIIRKLYQDRAGFCEIDIATRSAEVFQGNPHVHAVLDPRSLRRLDQGYDIVINFDMALERNKNAHISHAYWFHAFGRRTGLEDTDLQPALYPSASESRRAADFAKAIGKRYIVCHNRVDTTQPYRNVPLLQWRDLLLTIAREHDVAIVQVGVPPNDVSIDGHACLVDARATFNIRELKSLIDGATLFLGTDAGPLHVAACTATPIVCFFTLAHHDVRRPLRRGMEERFRAITPQIDCYGCVKDYALPWGFSCRRGDHACVNSFDSREALTACSGFIDRQ